MAAYTRMKKFTREEVLRAAAEGTTDSDRPSRASIARKLGSRMAGDITDQRVYRALMSNPGLAEECGLDPETFCQKC